jgi:hypothetical protein
MGGYGGSSYARQDGVSTFTSRRITRADRKTSGDGSDFTIRIRRAAAGAGRFRRPLHTRLSGHCAGGAARQARALGNRAAWLDRLKAPSKRIVWFENSGHCDDGREVGAHSTHSST